jgi:hypothetical protein
MNFKESGQPSRVPNHLSKDEPPSGLDCPGISMPRRISVKRASSRCGYLRPDRRKVKVLGSERRSKIMAGAAGLEPATLGFGDMGLPNDNAWQGTITREMAGNTEKPVGNSGFR